MLLFNICMLVGAILTPPPFRSMYSTCIILLCLYQIYRKDWLGLLIVSISLVALIGGNAWKELPKSVDKDGFYWHPSDNCLQLPAELISLNVLIKSAQGYEFATICTTPNAPSQVPVKLHFAELFGGYREHLAYVKGVDAVLYLPKFNKSTEQQYWQLEHYSSWRFAYSIIKGDRSGWDERDKWLVNYLGISHLFVVSGLHVGFVCFLSILLARMLWRYLVPLRVWVRYRLWLYWVVAVPACFAYTYWCGLGEPAIRASLMACMFLTAQAFFHRVGLITVLLFCAWCMLLQWPGRVFDPSFWLSFSFVALIALIQNRVKGSVRVIWAQCLMSIFAIILTLGWQLSISPLTIVINLVLIPFVAFVWFPCSLLALVELAIFDSSFLYKYLDLVLLWFYGWLDEPIFWAKSIPLNDGVNIIAKCLLVMLAFWAVYWLPSRRAVIYLSLLILVVTNGNWDGRWKMQWQRERYDVVVRQFGEQGDGYYGNPRLIKLAGLKVALDPAQDDLSMLALHEDWDVAVTDRPEMIELLQGLQVQVLKMEQGERLKFYQTPFAWRVESSDCYQILNLVKTVACEHAEWLESVLNYSQFDTGGLGVRAF